jgi:hypothetical protein
VKAGPEVLEKIDSETENCEKQQESGFQINFGFVLFIEKPY